MTFTPYHQVNFANIRDRSQYFFEKDFADETCASREEYILTTVKFFDFQLRFTLVLDRHFDSFVFVKFNNNS